LPRRLENRRREPAETFHAGSADRAKISRRWAATPAGIHVVITTTTTKNVTKVDGSSGIAPRRVPARRRTANAGTCLALSETNRHRRPPTGPRRHGYRRTGHCIRSNSTRVRAYA
jgi:hypothetical protein